MPIQNIDNIVIRGSKLYYIFLRRCNRQSNMEFNKCPP